MKIKPRDLLLLSVSVVCLGGSAWWRTRFSPTPEIATAPPQSTNSGPFRLLVAPWQPQSVSAGDLATGHTAKLGTRFWVSGYTPGHLDFLSHANLTRELYLQYKQHGAWKTVQSPGGWNQLRTWTGTGKLSRRLDVALPLGSVPREASELRLHGILTARICDKRKTGDHFYTIHSSTIDVPLKKSRWSAPPTGKTRPALKVLKTDVRLCGDAANAPEYDRLYSESSHDPDFVNAKVHIALRWDHPLWQRQPQVMFTTQRVQLLDDAGKDWLSHAPGDESQNMCQNIGAVRGFSSTPQFYFNGKASWGAAVNTSLVPRRAGQLRLRALIAPEWNNGTTDAPVQIEAVVRPRWLTQLPPELTVHKVSVAMGKPSYFAKALCPIVTAELNYTGTKPVFPRGESQSMCAWEDGTSSPCWEEHDSANAQIPFGQFVLSRPLREAKPNENELIVSWSQRVEDKTTRAIPPSLRGDFSTKVLEPKIYGQRIIARYALTDWRPGTGSQRFHAEIGLRDQGLIPLSIDLP